MPYFLKKYTLLRIVDAPPLDLANTWADVAKPVDLHLDPSHTSGEGMGSISLTRE